MKYITEIIPDNMPEWMKDSMDKGQLFNHVIKRVKELEDQLSRPAQSWLGLATTKELLEEIYARIEIDGKLDYKTVGG